ncbi:ABC transporter permease [Catalinimonas niigatensis]|uniref:ABC transporter permease n=1 Tax=Catalinimonas niigatensis TaxID=1397264 RepID=UPI002664F70A|nr:ABC transporter permease [Catalinimonas niigatensis]WPP48832.1 ABC transporter permease [Catalinimonas niigatensis]
MLKNYLKIAYRNLLKQKFYALINILGLAVGMASALFITLYVLDELRYDAFHEHADRMYRVRHKFVAGEREFDMEDVAPAFVQGVHEMIPKIEKSIRMEYPNPYIYKKGDEILEEQVTIRSDPNFFSFFGFRLLAGDPETLLSAPHSIVLTQKVADAYFGLPEHHDYSKHPALGKALTSEGEAFTVTGIAENPPGHSHLDFDIIMSNISAERVEQLHDYWLPAGFLAYVVLQEGIHPESLKSDFLAMEKKFEWPVMQQRLAVPLATLEAQQDELGHYLLPITDIHLVSEGNMKYVYILSVIGMFMLLIACINYMNLATARSTRRAKEVGIRKALGTTRKQLVGQFMSESILMALLSMLLALGLTEILHRPFSSLSGKELSLNILQEPWWILILLFLTLFIGIIAGLYPSFYLSVFKPVEVLKGKIIQSSKSRFRNGLVVFQFCISAILIICVILVYQQLLYMQSKDVGFNKENVLLIPNAYSLKNKEVFRQTLLQNVKIEEVSFSSTAPGDHFDAFTTYHTLGSETKHQAKWLGTDAAFFDVFDLQLLEGKNIKADTLGMKEVLLNESAARQLGVQQVTGSTIETFWGEKYNVAGIVEDFNFEHLRLDIMPLLIIQNTGGWPYYVSVRIKSGNIQQTLSQIETIWWKHNQDAPFTYSFLDRKFNELFQKEQRLGVIGATFTGITIFIACIGLLGLVAYIAEQRTKEIGIRKVLGASVKGVVILLSGSFMRLILLAFFLAIPLAYWLMQQWLSDFAYRISVEAWPFLLAVVSLLLIILLTVSFQSVKAALANPVDSLRNE